MIFCKINYYLCKDEKIIKIKIFIILLKKGIFKLCCIDILMKNDLILNYLVLEVRVDNKINFID